AHAGDLPRGKGGKRSANSLAPSLVVAVPGRRSGQLTVLLPRAACGVDEPVTWPFRVELRGFEPLTPSMRTRCATGLRYSPWTASQRSKCRVLLALGGMTGAAGGP